MVDRAGLAAIDTDEGHPTVDALGWEPGCELLFDAEAIHEDKQPGIRSEARGDEGMGVGQSRGLEGADDEVRGTDFRRIADGIDMGEVEVTRVAPDVESRGSYRSKVPAHVEPDVVAGARQQPPVVGADSPGADNRDFHAPQPTTANGNLAW